MATPKIKLYRLFPGYASQNDNDIQSATNDQLLPVTLKNIMPTNAYTLIGVGEKIQQALLPVLSFKNQQTCVKVADGLFTLPKGVIQDNQLFKCIVANRTNVMPLFYQKNNQDKVVEYKPGVDYIYVKDYQTYIKNVEASSKIKFILYYNQTENNWYIQFVDANIVKPATIYVKNIFSLLLNKIQIANLRFDSIQSIYYLSKLHGVNQVIGDRHQFIPVVGQFASYHLRPQIKFQVTAQQVMSQQQYQTYVNSLSSNTSSTSDNSDSSYNSSSSFEDDFYVKTVVLNQQNRGFTIDQNFRLTSISNNSISVKFGDKDYFLPSGLVYEKDCTLQYYVIPKLSQLYASGKINLNNLMYISQQQDIYNGTQDAIKPNTLYLQFVKSAKMQNIDSNGLFVSQNYLVKTDSLTNITAPKLTDYIQYCRGIIPRDEKSSFDISDVCGKFRYVYNYKQHKSYIKTNYQDKNLNFPDSQYLLDVDRGLYYFRSYISSEDKYIKTPFDEQFCKNNDYFFSTYYHRVQMTKLFISDFQSWVTQHLRNNPDIFYGKKDYSGDDYIDANENAIKVGAIPQYLQGGYTISFRNGSVTFASDTQDLDYVGSVDQLNVSTNENSGKITGGVARANFAYYNGLQNVLDQKLQWDEKYSGGGYKYRAMNDKQYPDSIGRRWVKRQNSLQFIGASFVTQKLNDKGELTTYNLPDLQTVQLQKLSKYGFAKCMLHSGFQNTAKIFLDYFITTNNFSYPFVFKISNFRRLINNDDRLYLTTMTQENIKKRHSNLLGVVVSDYFDTQDADQKFQQNEICFQTLQGQQLQHINVKYGQQSILPIIKVTIPVLTDKINSNVKLVQISKNKQFEYSNFELYTFGSDNKLSEPTILNNIVDVEDYIYVSVPQQNQNDYYIKYRMTTKLYRSTDTFDGRLSAQMIQSQYDTSSSSNSSDSSYSADDYKMISLNSNYKVQKSNNGQLIFSISNVNQTVYFRLSVIDFYSIENTYASTIIYTIKKYDL